MISISIHFRWLTAKIPYLNNESYGARKTIVDMIKHRNHRQNYSFGRAGTYTERAKKLAAVVQQYGASVHMPRSLDESYYLGLTENDMVLRDDDQVVSKDWSR
jgi:hypothetical protein